MARIKRYDATLGEWVYADTTISTPYVTSINGKSGIVTGVATEDELTAYAKTEDIPEVYNDTAIKASIAAKQDIISDLATIRSGAAKGETALQEVPSTYRTAAAQDLIHDTTKQDILTDADKQAIADLRNVPTKVSELTNDSGYVTKTYVDTQDSAIKTTISELDTTKLANKLLAVSEAEQIVINYNEDDKTDLEKFFEDNNGYDYNHIIDFGNLIESSSTKYYTDIAVAATDITNATDNSTTTSDGAVCRICKNADGITCIQLLQDITLSASIALNNTILDLNGHTISRPSRVMSSAVSSTVIVYNGNIVSENTSSAAQVVCWSNNYTTNIFVNVNITLNDNLEYTNSIFKIATQTSHILYNCNINFTANKTTNNGLCGVFYAMTSVTSYKKICIVDCDITIANNNQGLSTVCGAGPFYGELFIKNSKLVCTNLNYETTTSQSDSYSIAIQGVDKVVIIDSEIESTNACLENCKEVYIENSKLSGRIHGGLYASSADSISITKWRVKNTEIKFDDPTGYSNYNLYSCYIGYNANAKFENCKFTSYNDAYNRPAIKMGTADCLYTQAYFSNCEMDSIRVDSGCIAYMGLGMSDSLKAQSVSGKIIDRGTESYGFNLVKNDTGTITVGSTTITESQLQALLATLNS